MNRVAVSVLMLSAIAGLMVHGCAPDVNPTRAYSDIAMTSTFKPVSARVLVTCNDGKHSLTVDAVGVGIADDRLIASQGIVRYDANGKSTFSNIGKSIDINTKGYLCFVQSSDVPL